MRANVAFGSPSGLCRKSGSAADAQTHELENSMLAPKTEDVFLKAGNASLNTRV